MYGFRLRQRKKRQQIKMKQWLKDQNLKFIIVIIFGLIAFKTIQNASGEADGLGIWFLPLTLGLIFIPLTYYIIKTLKIKQ
jgi:hydrogenase-4 membrane subunit HyfE